MLHAMSFVPGVQCTGTDIGGRITTLVWGTVGSYINVVYQELMTFVLTLKCQARIVRGSKTLRRFDRKRRGYRMMIRNELQKSQSKHSQVLPRSA